MSSSGSPSPPLPSIRSIPPPALHPLIPSSPPFFPPPLSVWTLASFLFLSLFPSLFHLFIFPPPSCRVKQRGRDMRRGWRRKKKPRPIQGGNQRAQETRKKTPKQKTSPLCDRWGFYRKKKAVFSQFPVDILCSLFPSPLSSPPPVRLRHHGRLFEINKDGCWLMKVVGVGRWLAKRSFCFTQITACVVPTRDGHIPQQFIQMRCRSMMAFAEIRIWWVLTGRRGGGRLDSIQWERRGGDNGWLLVKNKWAGAVAIQKREDIRWKNYVLVIIITEHKTQTNKTLLAKGP